MERETSVTACENNFRERMHLQFFADAEDGGDSGAEPEGGADDDFAAGMMEDFGENQLGDAPMPPAEEKPPANQGEEKPPANPQEEKPPDAAEKPKQQDAPPPQDRQIPLVFNGARTQLPESAVRAVAGALHADTADVITLLQKGMNYESKAERELRILDEYAGAAGMDRSAYLQQLEQGAQAARLQSETARVMERFPGTPQEAAQTIAAQSLAAQKQQRELAAHAQREQLEQTRARIAQTVSETKTQALIKAWDGYEAISGVHSPENIPPRVMELVQNEGMNPTAAHWRFMTETAEQQIADKSKMENNKKASAGSQRGAGADTADAFLTGLME